MIKKTILLCIVLAIIFFIFFSFNKISGSDNSLIQNDSYILAEKFSYLFQSPKAGDFILFQNNQIPGVDFVGQIFDVTEEGNVRKYHVSAKKIQSIHGLSLVTKLLPKLSIPNSKIHI